MIVDELKKSVLYYAFNGNLTRQYSEEVVKILPKKYNTDDKKVKDNICNRNLPSNWSIGKFGKYITLISGQDLTNDRYYSIPKETSIPYLTGASNMSNGNLIINRYTDTPASIASEGNILLTCKGTIGETLILKEKKVHIARQFMAIVPNEMNTKYILYFLRNSIMELNRNAKSIIPGIDREFVLNLDLPIPPIEEQQRIVDKIEELFAKLNEIKPIEERLKAIKGKFPSDMKKAILSFAFNGKLTIQNDTDTNIETYINLVKNNDKIKRKDLLKSFEPPYEIPINWRWVQLGDVTGIYGGKRIPAGRKLSDVDTGHKYIRVADMNDYTVVLDNIKYVPNDIFESIKSYIINKEDLYITVAGTIGKIGYIPEILDGANLTENANKIVFKNINKMWLFYLLSSPIVQVRINSMITKVGQPKLAIKRISNILIPIPPIEEQQRIVNKLEQLLPLCDDIEKLIKES